MFFWTIQRNIFESAVKSEPYLMVQKIVQHHGSLEFVDSELRLCLLSPSFCFCTNMTLCSASKARTLVHILQRLGEPAVPATMSQSPDKA